MRTIIFLLLILSGTACNSQEISPDVKVVTHKLGDDSVSIEILNYGKNTKPVFVSLHDDEVTAVNTGKLFLKKNGGMLVRIVNNGKRMIEFTSGNQLFKFDPNRMFSTRGIIETLIKNNNFSPDAVQQVNAFADKFLSLLPRHDLLIALHNNDEGNLTVHSFSTSGTFRIDARHVRVHPGQDQDNFYLVTDSTLHRILGGKYNSVLQHNQRATDDGSLSVFYGRRNLKYINIEVQHGKSVEQLQMIQFAMNALEAK